MPTDLEQVNTTQEPNPASPVESMEEEQLGPVDYGEWNEQLPQELQDCLKKLCQHFADEFKYPRRLEVMQAWQARSFWREMQHLNWNWEGDCWNVLGPAGVGSGGYTTDGQESDSSVLYSTNIYKGFGKNFMAIITQVIPNLRFEPENPDDAADIATAAEADGIKKFIQHENDPMALMLKAAYYAWTDGRIHGWTRWEMDKRTGQYRETQSIEGSMETKVPVIYECMEEYPYVIYSSEHHLSSVRAKVKGRNFDDKDYWKKIKGGSSGNGQDMYERTARISVKQGISMKSAGGDAYGTLVTTQRTWLRPTTFMEDTVEEQYRDQLEAQYPSGCYVEFDNGVYTGSKDANMDNEWTIENVDEGDGSYRNAEGTCLISVQQRANDIINISQDVYEKTISASHWDDKLFDVDGMRRQRAMPGARYGVNMEGIPDGVGLESRVFYEPPATVSADMLTYLKELMTDIPEFLTGISAVLFGNDSQGDKSGKALSIQQAAAKGRIGLPFQVMKRIYSKMMEQAVRLAVRMRKDDVKVPVPNDNGQIETLAVAIGGLTGKIRCYPDSDENYPESWVSKRNTYMQLLQMATQDPVLGAILKSPKNQNFAKKMIGLQELEIPDADSWNKQMAEINIMLTEPIPPPVPQPPLPVPNPMAPGQIETIQPPPIQESSLPIDKDYDNHEAEYLTVTIWINSSKGQQTKQSNPDGFMNVRLHGLQHKSALIEMQPPAPAPAPPAEGKGKGEPSPPRIGKPDMAAAA